MRHENRRRTDRLHALRLDLPAIAQAGLAAAITLVVAWIIQVW
jgi:hypothetical protein